MCSGHTNNRNHRYRPMTLYRPTSYSFKLYQ